MIIVTADIPDERVKNRARRPPHLHWKFDERDEAYVFISELRDRFGDSLPVGIQVVVCEECSAEV